MAEISFILRNTQGYTAEYLEKKPVPVRKKMVHDILEELDKNSDGAQGIRNHAKK